MIIALGFIASALVTIMAFTIKRRAIIILSLLLNIITTAQYGLLGEWGTVYLTTISGLYAWGLLDAKKIPFIEGKITAYILAVIYTVGFFFINGLNLSWGLVAYGATLIGAFMLLFKNHLTIKYLMLASGLLWTVFQLASGAYGQLPGEALYVAGIIVSIVILRRAKARGEDVNDVPEISTMIRQRVTFPGYK